MTDTNLQVAHQLASELIEYAESTRKYSDEFQLKLERSRYLSERIHAITVTMDELQHQFNSTNDDTYSNCLIAVAEKLQQEYKDLRKDYSATLPEKNVNNLFIDLDRIDFTLGCG